MSEPCKYRKRPVEIEAMQWTGDTHEMRQAVREWVDAAIDETALTGLAIETLEGWLNVSPGDWIIKGVKGEFYPCKPDVFDATYDAVEGVS